MFGKIAGVVLAVMLVPGVVWAQNDADQVAPAATITSTTSGDVVLGPMTGRGSATVQFLGTWTGTYAIEGTLGANCHQTAGAAAATWATVPNTTSITGNGLTKVDVSGIRCIRVNDSGWASGTTTVIISASSAGGGGAGGTLGDVEVSIVGFATEAKQDSLIGYVDALETAFGTDAIFGTAGTPDADVLSVQGITNGTALTVTGTVTANLGATDNAVLDDIVDGTLVVQVSGGDGSPTCAIGACSSVSIARPTIEVDASTGAPVQYSTVWVPDIPYDGGAFDGLGLMLRGITTAVDAVSVNDSLVTATADQYGSMRMLPSVGGVDLTMTVAGRIDTTSGGAFADEGTFTYATDRVTAFGAVAESTTDTLADGKIGAPVMTLARYLRTTPSGYLSGGGVPVAMKSDNTNNDDKTAICTGPCTVYTIVAFNHAAASAFLRCENDTSANTTPGSETASDGEPDFEIPGATTGAGYVVNYAVGASFSTALTCWIATGEAATDNTDAATDDVSVQFTRVQ